MSDISSCPFQKLFSFLSRKPKTENELIQILREAQKNQIIDHDALQMIEGVIAVSDKKVRDIMIPRPQMVVIDADASPKSVLPILIESQHSRFPVVSDDNDKVIGIILAKDFLQLTNETVTHTQQIRDLLRPAVFIPESKKLDVLLKEFRLNRNHMAIVVDEYGKVSGLVTIEDVLEEIVGEIEDEYDIDEKDKLIQKIGDTLFLVNALTPMSYFNDYFNVNLTETDADTIGGLALEKLGYLPKRNEKLTIDNLDITVIKASKRGIQLLQIKRT